MTTNAHALIPKTHADASQLDALPARAAHFIHGVVTTPAVRATLALAGLSRADLDDGRARLAACLADVEHDGTRRDPDDERRAALAELNAWDEPAFARFGAALKQHAPSAHAYVFAGLAPSADADEASRAIATFLSRVGSLEVDGVTADDRQAVDLLDARGLTHDVRGKLLTLVAAAMRPCSPSEVPGAPPSGAAHVARLTDLRAWYEEWADTARALIKSRSVLARLGLKAPKIARKGRARKVEPVADTERAPGQPLRLYAAETLSARPYGGAVR